MLRVPGTAVLLNRGKDAAPLAMRANVERNHVLHEHVVIVSIETQPVPYVPTAERLVIDDLGYGHSISAASSWRGTAGTLGSSR